MIDIVGTNAILGDKIVHWIPDDLIPVIDALAEQYKITVTLPYVRKKKAYTLYQVWKEVDRKEKADAEEWDAYNTTYRPYARWAKDGQFIDCTLDPAYSPCEYPKCRTCPMRVESNLLKKLKILEEKVAKLEEEER